MIYFHQLIFCNLPYPYKFELVILFYCLKLKSQVLMHHFNLLKLYDHFLCHYELELVILFYCLISKSQDLIHYLFFLDSHNLFICLYYMFKLFILFYYLFE
jgi:hypothetical protein